MAEPKSDKKTASIQALKDANKHLTEVFADLSRKDAIIAACASDLSYTARQCGDLKVEVWVGNNKQITPLKTWLETIATNLNGAR